MQIAGLQMQIALWLKFNAKSPRSETQSRQGRFANQVTVLADQIHSRSKNLQIARQRLFYWHYAILIWQTSVDLK
jgi:hypothetical protein